MITGKDCYLRSLMHARTHTCIMCNKHVVYLSASEPSPGRMNFFNSSFPQAVPFHAIAMHYYHGMDFMVPHFPSGIRLASLPQLSSFNQPQMIEKHMSELNCHEETFQDKDFLANPDRKNHATRVLCTHMWRLLQVFRANAQNIS